MCEIAIIKNLDKDAKIAESTKVAREAFNYVVTKHQLDIIYMIISLVQPDDNNFTKYSIPLREIAKLLNPANPDSAIIKNDVLKAVRKIMDSHFEIYDKESEKILMFHWIEAAELDLKNKKVEFILKDQVRQFYLLLKQGEYTVYKLQDMLNLSSLFHANVFRWCMSNSGFNNKIFISLEQAKLKFDSNKTETKEFNRKLDRAIKAINDKTNLDVKYSIERTGRNINGYNFKIKNKYKELSK